MRESRTGSKSVTEGRLGKCSLKALTALNDAAKSPRVSCYLGVAVRGKAVKAAASTSWFGNRTPEVNYFSCGLSRDFVTSVAVQCKTERF